MFHAQPAGPRFHSMARVLRRHPATIPDEILEEIEA